MNEPVVIIACSKNQYDVIYYDLLDRGILFAQKPKCVIASGYGYESLRGLTSGTILLGDGYMNKLTDPQKQAWSNMIADRQGRGSLKIFQYYK